MNLYKIYNSDNNDHYYCLSEDKEAIYEKYTDTSNDIEINNLGFISKEEVEVFKKYKIL